MEKISLGFQMANNWTDPTLLLTMITFAPPTMLFVMGYLLGLKIAIISVSFFCSSFAMYWFTVHTKKEPADCDKYIEFKDEEAKKEWSGYRIPMFTLGSLYLNDHIKFKGDVLEILRDHRNEFVHYRITFDYIKFLLLQLFPNDANSSLKDLDSTKKEIAEHYDRGNDFFEAFLGPRMVYTSGVFHGLDQSLEEAQDNKMSMICDKLQLKEGETILDIGCGWGTLLCHAAKHYGARAVGVTLSVEGAKYCKDQAKSKGLDDKVSIMRCDYREIDPQKYKFNKVSSIEMAEHVGLRNFQLYLENVKALMEDDGMFLMQVAGLRKGSNWEDLNWGLFMSRYIFPGADASTPLNWYIKQLEQAGFEVSSVDNIGRHYSHTLHGWYNHFQKNRAAMEKSYGGYLCRLWDFFLAWSVVASGQGSAVCYQILAFKSIYSFPRDRFCTKENAPGSKRVK